MGIFKKPTLNVTQQYHALKRDFSFGVTKVIGINEISWQGKLKSSPIGDEYEIKLTYKKNFPPKVYVLEPSPLKLPPGAIKLEHVYDHKKQQLCLYYPKAKEWNEKKTISSTIMAWAIEWLYHYEIWLITGKWQGGGIHPENIKSEKTK